MAAAEDDLLSMALIDLGYVRKQNWIYRLDTSARRIEHFLYFVPRHEKHLIAVHFGFRIYFVEEFAIHFFSRFAAGDFFPQQMLDENNCSMRYSFSRFHSMYLPGYWPLDNKADWTAALLSDLRTYLVPFTRRVSSYEEMFNVLVLDEEPCPWIANNAAIRVAQLILLGSRLGKPHRQLQTTIAPRLSVIQQDLNAERASVSANEYIAALFRETVGH